MVLTTSRTANELPDEPTNLRSSTLRGFAWKLAAEFVTQASRITVTILLARLLDPSDIGLAGLVLAFSVVVPALSDLALGAALIHRATIDDDDKSTVFWSTTALGVVMTAVGVGFSWPLAQFEGEPRLQPLFAVFSLAFLIASLSATPTSLLTRAMHFRALEIRVIIATVAGGATSIVLAVLHYGPWAIVVGELVNRVMSLILLWGQCGWRPDLRFSRASLRGMLAYSGSVFGAQFLLQLPLPLQNVLVARFLGAKPLGVLVLAQQIVLLPLNRIASPIQAVMFPALSRIQDQPARIAAAWFRVNQVVAAVAFPALTGLVILAPEFQEVVLGAKWHRAVLVMRILAIAGAVQALQRLNMSILQARARTASFLWLAIASVATTAVAIASGSPFGLTGVALFLAGQAFVVQIAFMAITARAVDLTLWRCITPLGGVAAATALMALALVGGELGLGSAGLSASLRLVLGVAIGGTAFAVSFAVFCRPLALTLAAGVRSRLRRSGKAQG